MLPQSILDAIKQHAHEEPDQEVCGFIIHGEVHRAINVNKTPREQFTFDDDSSEIVVELASDFQRPILYHSHITEGDDDWSLGDIQLSRQTGLAVVMYNVWSHQFKHYDPNEPAGLLGREWHWLTANCYTLVQDFYKQALGVSLQDVWLRTHDDWDSPDWRGFLDNLNKCGFQLIAEEPALGDLVVMQIGRTVSPNHCAMIWSVERNEICHHLANKLSCVEPYDRSFRKATYGVYRHVSQLG